MGKKAAAKPKAKPTHPPTSAMIVAAIKGLADRKGASTVAIKKYIAANNKVDIVKLSPFIKKALKSMVEKKALVQTKGTGASGRFKLSEATKKPAAKKPAAKKAKASPKKAAKKPAAKKAESPKKAAKKPAAKKPAAKAKPAKKAAAKKPAAKKSPKKA